MTRALEATLSTELTNTLIRPVLLVALPFRAQTVYLTSGHYNISYGGNTYLGNGWLQPVRTIEDTEELVLSSVEIELLGASQEVRALALSDVDQSLLAYVRIGLLDAAGALIGTPYLAFQGYIDTADISESVDSTLVTFTLESDAMRWQIPNEHAFTDAFQQSQYTGDLGFQYVAQLEDVSLFWGKAAKKQKKSSKNRADQKTKYINVRKPRRIAFKKIVRGAKTIFKNTAPTSIVKISATENPRRREPILGHEVSVRTSEAPHRIIYGRVRCGGYYSFIETNSNVSATLLTGSSNSQIAWTARSAGAGGNAITVEIIVTGTHGTLDVTVVGNAITVRCESISGASDSTADEVIYAIRHSGPANALVSVSKADGDGSGFVLSQTTTNLSGGGGTWLHNFITFAGHEIDSVTKLFLGEDEVVFGGSPDNRWATGKYANRVFQAVQPGTETQEAQPDLVGQLPLKWTANHRQLGCAGSYIITVWNANTFPDSIPDISFEIKGKKCYDPRTGLTVWTQNAALCLADFLMDTKHGLGIPLAAIDSATLISAADICDQTVTLTGGGTEARYTINGYFDASLDPFSVIKDMLLAMAGTLVRTEGKWYILPASWRSSSGSLTDADFIGPIDVSAKITRQNNFNAIKGQFISPNDDWKSTDYVPVTNAYYLARDGGIRLWEQVNYQFVTSEATAQRLGKIQLEKIRQGISFRAQCSLAAYRFKAGDTIQVTLASYGWTAKAFEILNCTINFDLDKGIYCEIAAQETASEVYAWNNGEETVRDIAPDTTLPDPFTTLPPTGLTLTSGTSELYIREDGTVFSRLKAAWTAPNDVFVTSGGSYDLQYKRSADGSWSQSTILDGEINFYRILDVQDGQAYDVRLRSRNSLNVVSEWVTVTGHIVVGKTAPPLNVTGFAGTVVAYGIQLGWDSNITRTPVGDIDLAYYIVKQGSSWAVSSEIGRPSANGLRVETRNAGTHQFLIKAVDTSGNESAAAVLTSVIITAPAAPVPSWAIAGQSAVLSWTVPAAQFAIAGYNIYLGDTYAGAVLVDSVTATAFSIHASWSGLHRYWIAAVDVAGNVGSAASVDVLIVAPGQITTRSIEVIDNNILLRWEHAAGGSLPIAYTEIRRGATFAGAEVIGQVGGTFQTYFEIVSGTYTYWLAAVDTAGNYGPEASLTATVSQPPDFILHSNILYTLTSDLANGQESIWNINVMSHAEPSGFDILVPVVGETWQDHFINNSWTSPQDQITAGYPIYMQPAYTGTPAGTMEDTIDLGTVLGGSLVSISFTQVDLDGSCTITPSLAYSVDGSSWTTEAGVSSVYATNFRYIKWTLTVTNSDPTTITKVQDIRVITATKEISEDGIKNVTTNPTTVTLSKTFVDISSIQVTPAYQSGKTLVANYSFVDDPYPTTFEIYLYDATDGSAETGEVSWRVKGV